MGLTTSSNISRHLSAAKTDLRYRNVKVNQAQSLPSRSSGYKEMTVICKALVLLRM